MKITDNIWQVGGDGISAPGDAAIYAVAFGGKAALVDAGCGRGHSSVVGAVARSISSAASVQYLFLTHCHYDHTGGAEALRRRYGCTVVAHELDARYLEAGDSEVTAASWYGATIPALPVDHKITGDSETFQLGSGEIRALHCPGHSPGSVVYLTESEGKKVLFGQDIHGPLHPAILSNREDYLISLNMLLQLDADILCEGHYGVFHGQKKIRKFIQSFIH